MFARIAAIAIVTIVALGAGDGRAASVEIDLDAIATPVSPRLRAPAGLPQALQLLPPHRQAVQPADQEASLPPPHVAGPNADALFVLGYGLERAGRPLEAEARYRQLLAVFPNSSAAPLATDRLEALRQAAAAALPPLAAPPPAPRQVCTPQGLFANRSGWCGRVRATRDGSAEVEVAEVRANGLFVLGLRASPCTGNRWLDGAAVGAVVTVPESCLTSPW
ncbi:MAG: hypothetical protein FJX35_00625 [Alphaproteobacteria bacterium]|nr:hypothetical protein [Alphaproteobacteria bacterium]